MLQNHRDAAMRWALELSRRRPVERRAVRFVWTVEGRVRRLVVASGDRKCACLRAHTVARPKTFTSGREG